MSAVTRRTARLVELMTKPLTISGTVLCYSDTDRTLENLSEEKEAAEEGDPCGLK